MGCEMICSEIYKDKEFIIDENDKNFNKELRSKRKDILNITTNTVVNSSFISPTKNNNSYMQNTNNQSSIETTSKKFFWDFNNKYNSNNHVNNDNNNINDNISNNDNINNNNDNNNKYEINNKINNRNISNQFKNIENNNSKDSTNNTYSTSYLNNSLKIQKTKDSKLIYNEISNNSNLILGYKKWADGDSYFGYFKISSSFSNKNENLFKFENIGKYNSLNSLYRGYFKSNKISGFGIEIFLNDNNNDEILKCQKIDEEISNSNSYYIGEYLNGYKYGIGFLLISKNYLEYRGQFNKNNFNGYGYLENYKDNITIYSEFKENKFFGNRVIIEKTTDNIIIIYKGEINDNFEYNGFGIKIEKYNNNKNNYKIIVGIWENNKLNGNVCINKNKMNKFYLYEKGKEIKEIKNIVNNKLLKLYEKYINEEIKELNLK